MSDLIICPHCGQVIDVSDPRVHRLTPATFAVFHAMKQAARNGEAFGVTRVAKLSSVTPATAYYHLRQLKRVELVNTKPKRKGGTYQVYTLVA